MAGSMGRMYLGTSGLQSQQNAINTTAHNLTNLATEGYSRQQVLLTDLSYQKVGRSAISYNQIGLGTRVQATRTTRDHFPDYKFRLQTARQEYYETKSGVIEEVQEFFGETEGSTFRDYMQNMWNAMQDVQKEPNSYVARTSLVATASSFVARADEIYTKLVEYQENLNTNIQDQVDQINQLANKIHDLNLRILKVEGAKVGTNNGHGGVPLESANDMKDARNLALDELSKLIKIDIREQENGSVDVYAEDHILVAEDRTFTIETKPVQPGSALITAYWQSDGDPVFNLARTVIVGDNSDSGSLKGLLSARGDFTPTYADVPIRENFATEADYQTALADYNVNLANRDIPALIAQFDTLIHGMVTQINDVLAPNKTITDVSGNTYTVLDTEKAGKGYGEGNEIQGTELFVRKGYDRYREETITYVDDNGVTQTETMQVYNQEDPADYYTLYTLGQLQINDDLVKNPALLPLTRVNNEEYQEVANELLNLWNQDFATLDPNTLVMNDYNNYYASMVGDYADKGYTYGSLADKQAALVNEVNNQRQEVVGVSSDEELTNLIRYQHAYNASSRYITVVSEMIEHVVERLGT